jgi:hypothetical protein
VTLHPTSVAISRSRGTARQIYYWDASKAISPAQPANGSGSRMAWSDDDIARLQVIVAVARDWMPAPGRGTDLVHAIWTALSGPRDLWPTCLYFDRDRRGWHCSSVDEWGRLVRLCIDVDRILMRAERRVVA